MFSSYSLGLIIRVEGTLYRFSYESILKDHVHPYMMSVFPREDGIFQHDNTPCHTARSVRVWLEKHRPRLQSPSLALNSPDFNPVEDLWDRTTSIVVFAVCLLLHAPFNSCGTPCRQHLSVETHQHLTESLPARLIAVRAAKGGFSEYQQVVIIIVSRSFAAPSRLLSSRIFVASARLVTDYQARRPPSPRTFSDFSATSHAASMLLEGLQDKRGRGRVVVRLLAFQMSEPGSIPGGVAPRFSHVPDDAVGRRFSRGSPVFPTLSFRRCSILTSLRPHRLSSQQQYLSSVSRVSSSPTTRDALIDARRPRCSGRYQPGLPGGAQTLGAARPRQANPVSYVNIPRGNDNEYIWTGQWRIAAILLQPAVGPAGSTSDGRTTSPVVLGRRHLQPPSREPLRSRLHYPRGKARNGSAGLGRVKVGFKDSRGSRTSPKHRDVAEATIEGVRGCVSSAPHSIPRHLRRPLNKAAPLCLASSSSSDILLLSNAILLACAAGVRGTSGCFTPVFSSTLSRGPNMRPDKGEATYTEQRWNAWAGETGEPRETPGPVASSGSIPACENPEATPPGIEPDSPRWEACSLTTTAQN
ncbi:hypothetical protein PR048_027278 [Dryococelus australis]|uniref:Tc1-like transposase DDE domain-containing protein n=1 Tax=Dryococelus australis TaxID=614101 RepID=A0ABQ9GGM1_9NEOP|nr:hypothetical protein PR048_027278 [Dryococelus australis]